MEIMQVMGSLVCTQRVEGFAHQNLRVLRTPKGKLSVAVDPVGAATGNWVFTASGSAARHATGDASLFTDLTIGGIIDFWEPDG
ncbi:carboxysome peptide B [Synechococcus sp. CCY9201]|uniref:carboxysome peptide B n=1 Tax=unclassified Synechococcus TaxID=2626047 RepID=UPI0018CCDCE9|nr:MULTISPECIES: carboxysome peptide B [unclassified Synechococcus]MEA5423329.1 carboxysome peptide B [Synechococcus sp. CCY9202]MEA5475582.1 carboxysome peptide B [Synechococcus sp. CCY9201]QPN59960.1 carboxysome peptide B [Synechococcus sp. CBW1002]QPN66766.1 carboxysome peptide B [Synechococcus sp. CBW1006]CAK6692234.1 Ethanolamine utilization protein EutN [Synechococcus sp. CBW1107]